MRWRRIALGLVVLAVLGPGLFVIAARSGWLRPDETAMRARYGLANSRFVTIDGQALHLVDEGSGPPVVLVHGSFDNLGSWQDWADALKGRYRIIRFDRPGMGLSGPNPAGRYDGDAEAVLIGKLADRLGLQRFFLVGTSSGGEGVAHYAAQHPERLRGLILANIAASPLAWPPKLRDPWFKALLVVDPWLGGWHTRALWRGVLLASYAEPAKVTPALVREWTDLNNRAQGWPHHPRPSGARPSAGTPADLAAITVPTLLLWSDKDPEVPLEDDGRRALAYLGAPDKALVVVHDCGHMMAQECGPASVQPAMEFFDRIGAAAK